MAQVQILYVDDLDGSEADGTIRFGLDVNIHPLIRAGWLRVPPVTSGRDACLRRAGSQL